MEQILLDAATKATKHIIEETGHKPYVRSESWDYGIIYDRNQGNDQNVDQIEITKIMVSEPKSLQNLADDPEIVSLAASISELGLVQPIVLVRDAANDTYRISVGEKRLQACILLGWDKVPAQVKNPVGKEINRRIGMDDP